MSRQGWQDPIPGTPLLLGVGAVIPVGAERRVVGVGARRALRVAAVAGGAERRRWGGPGGPGADPCSGRDGGAAARRCGSDAGDRAWAAPAWATGGYGHRVGPPGCGGTAAPSCREPAERGTPRPASGKGGEKERERERKGERRRGGEEEKKEGERGF